jgi:hypothetical protein
MNMAATRTKKKTILLTAGGLGGIAAIITAISQICIPGIIGDCPPVPSSQKPTAVASVTPSEGNERDVFSLYGAQSFDPDGGTIWQYKWKQTGGPRTSLDSQTIDNPTFTAPFVRKDEVLQFQLTVTDDENIISAPETVNIKINDIQESPPTTREESPPTTREESSLFNLIGNWRVSGTDFGQSISGSITFNQDGSYILNYRKEGAYFGGRGSYIFNTFSSTLTLYEYTNYMQYFYSVTNIKENTFSLSAIGVDLKLTRQ